LYQGTPSGVPRRPEIRKRLYPLLSVAKLPQRLFIDLQALGIGQDGDVTPTDIDLG
jgi:hypothetical protein